MPLPLSLQDEWARFKGKVYPEGMSPEQNKQLHRAFFAGALVIAAELRASVELPEEIALKQLEALCSEAESACKQHAENCRGRN